MYLTASQLLGLTALVCVVVAAHGRPANIAAGKRTAVAKKGRKRERIRIDGINLGFVVTPPMPRPPSRFALRRTDCAEEFLGTGMPTADRRCAHGAIQDTVYIA